jgi:hypothetical protein
MANQPSNPDKGHSKEFWKTHSISPDNTRVTNARNSQAPIPKNEVRLTNNPGGVFDNESSVVPRDPGKLSKELDKLPKKK